MRVCNQTWLVDALCWPPQFSGVKGHVSRSKFKINIKCESLQLSNHMPVCNQTWFKDVLCWPPQYSRVKGHASRSKVKWGQIPFTCNTLLGLITFQPYRMPVCNQTWLVDALDWPPWYSGVKGHVNRSKVKWGQISYISNRVHYSSTTCLF